MTAKLMQGDCLQVLRTLDDKSVNCIVTSPPYYGLRDYGVAGQIGLEPTPDEYTAKLVEVFHEARRVLRYTGTLWLNLGDSYAGSSGSKNGNLKPKDLIGIPWRVAFALQADGFYLRSDIIWAKPNPMPESVTDRPTKSHEYIFLLSKSERYYYDNEAIKEPCVWSSVERLGQNIEKQNGSSRVPGKSNGNMKAVCSGKDWNPSMAGGAVGIENRKHLPYPMANKRDVWTVTTKPYKEAHFATFPPDLIEPCILAGCPVGGTVLDPFNGSGTTGAVSIKHHRNYIGIELNEKYIKLSERRFGKVQPTLVEVE